MGRMISGETPLVVFVSSRICDQTLWARKATFDVLQQPDWIAPWLFEYAPASSEPLSDSYLSKVRSSDLLIWLIDETTTLPVQNEIAAALETSRRVLMFRISPPPSDAATELLVSQVGTKWDYVADSIDLTAKLRLALGDAIVRTWRAAGRSTTPPMLEVLRDQSRSRCIDRWLATGLPQDIAITLADDSSVGALEIPSLDSRRFAILRAEIGAGKSLAAERVFQDAIARARTSKHERTPVFLEARHIVGSPEESITREVGNAPMLDGDTLLLVIDGLDEAPPDRRVPLARAARRFTAERESARAIVTSRPISDLGPDFVQAFVDVPPLSVEESLALMSRVAGRQIHETEFWDLPESLGEAIRRPLFAILLALHQREERLAAIPKGRLISDLVASSLGRASAFHESAFPLLRKLGRLVTEKGASIPIAEVATYAEAAPLLRSRLIVERNGLVNFPLVVLAEWFAARDLEAGVPPMRELVCDSDRLGKWLVPLAVCLSDTAKQTVARVLTPLASQRPAVGSRLLADAFSEWTAADVGTPLSSWQEFGARLHEAMTAWTEGLGRAAPLIAPVHSDGTLRTLGIRVEDSSVVFSWARRRISQTVVQLPDSAARTTDCTWRGATVRYNVVEFNGLPWMWTLDDLKHNATELLRQRALPLPAALRGEFGWRAVLSVVGRGGSLDPRPISKELIADRFCSFPKRGIYSSGGDTFDVEQVRDEIEQLIVGGNEEHVFPPWPGPERLEGGYVWNGYSPEALLSRTRAVYAAALDAYCEFVDRWFPRFRDDLELSAMRPCRLVGIVHPAPELDPPGRGPGICWYLEPTAGGHRFDVDLRLGREKERAGFLEHAEHKLGRGFKGHTVSLLNVFLVDAAEELAYSWLRRDLTDVHWA